MGLKAIAKPAVLGKTAALHKRRAKLLAKLSAETVTPKELGASSHSHHVNDLIALEGLGYVAVHMSPRDLRDVRTYNLTVKGLKLQAAMKSG